MSIDQSYRTALDALIATIRDMEVTKELIARERRCDVARTCVSVDIELAEQRAAELAHELYLAS